MSMFSSKKDDNLIFFKMKKVIYLSRDLEIKDYGKSKIRMKILCYEIFKKIRSRGLQLN